MVNCQGRIGNDITIGWRVNVLSLLNLATVFRIESCVLLLMPFCYSTGFILHIAGFSSIVVDSPASGSSL